jgi:hypothetical protein
MRRDQRPACERFGYCQLSGAEGTRTPDPLDANEVRYQTALQPLEPWTRLTGRRRRARTRSDRLTGRPQDPHISPRMGTGRSRAARGVALDVLGGMPAGGPAGLVAFLGGTAEGGGAQGGSTVVLAAYGGLLGGDPPGLAQSGTPDPGGDDGPLAQVDQVGQQDQERDREADPEPRPDQDNPGQLNQVEQNQGQEDPAPAVQCCGTAPAHGRDPRRRSARRDARGKGARRDPRRDSARRDPRGSGPRGSNNGSRKHNSTGRVDRPPAGDGTTTTAPGQDPRRGRRPLGLDPLGGVVPARQRGGEGQETGGGEHGEKHRGRHATPKTTRT